MEKLIAFDLYRKNDLGGHTMAFRKPLVGDEVYLARDADQLLAFANDAAAKGEAARLTAAGMEMRIAELELALNQIRNGCVDDGDEGNALFKLSPGEIRKLIDTWLMGRSSHD